MKKCGILRVGWVLWGVGRASRPCSETEYAELCGHFLLHPGATSPVMTGWNVEVQNLTVVSTTAGDFLKVESTSLPNYTITMTEELVKELDERPKAATDFADGATTAEVGDTIYWGMDIGYNSATSCIPERGYGFWPPGPDCCDGSYLREQYFPLCPEPASADEYCEPGLGELGVLVNGVFWFNADDGFTYLNQGDWTQLAPKFEVYDVDVCGGHAAGGNYHHHGASPCLETTLNETGSAHSTVYGIAGDGYLIYGPYQSDGAKATSCWVARDYDDPDDPYGCGGTGKRTCKMVDPFDASLGTVTSRTVGPSTDETIASLSNNTFTAVTGMYKEDYYFNASCPVDDYTMDAFNGHQHGDYGWHYHHTEDFPFSVGPRYYGKVYTNGVAGTNDCNTTIHLNITDVLLENRRVKAHHLPPPAARATTSPLMEASISSSSPPRVVSS